MHHVLLATATRTSTTRTATPPIHADEAEFMRLTLDIRQNPSNERLALRVWVWSDEIQEFTSHFRSRVVSGDHQHPFGMPFPDAPWYAVVVHDGPEPVTYGLTADTEEG